MKRKTILFLILISWVYCARSQSIGPSVISTSGGFYVNGSSISFTTGEMTMVETFSSGGHVLTQGFQQPIPWPVGIYEHNNFPFAYSVYPNPGNGNFNLAIQTYLPAQIDVVIFDAIGKNVIYKRLNISGSPQILPIELTEFSQGIYMLELITSDGSNKIESRSFQKLQLIK